MKTAKLTKDNLEDFTGHAALYELSDKVKYDDDKKTKYVICSTANAMFSGIETYIFPADKDGNILDWGELDGSEKGISSHKTVLKNAGYKLVK